MQNLLMAVKVGARTLHASKVQEILTKYGCNIKVRMGFHETNDNTCSVDGFIILQLFGNESEINEMYKELNAIDEVTAKFVEF